MRGVGAFEHKIDGSLWVLLTGFRGQNSGKCKDELGDSGPRRILTISMLSKSLTSGSKNLGQVT